MTTQNIEIYVNGEITVCPPGQLLEAFLTDFLARAGLTPDRVVVEINGQICKPENLGNRILNAKDQVEIIHFVGGG
ncbi:MAG: sulfur carrier protein ThiS [Deltaproteobacteria bacterium]|jgi:thiamine biosynthesis protein ThiS|nr:sulfur carrier protein ThiS [Deltaproteobacteria bacterium]